MKVTVELPDTDLEELCRLTGQAEGGGAIRTLITDALQLRRRTEIADKFMSGELGVELEAFEAGKARDRAKAQAFGA